jgi:hypothetical protein
MFSAQLHLLHFTTSERYHGEMTIPKKLHVHLTAIVMVLSWAKAVSFSYLKDSEPQRIDNAKYMAN